MADTYHPQPEELAQAFPVNTGGDLEAQVVSIVAARPLQVVGTSTSHPAFASIVAGPPIAQVQAISLSGFQPATRGVVVAYEHFPPGAETWPDDLKPQYRVPELTSRPLIEIDGTATVTFEVTVTNANGVVANPVFGSGGATFGVTLTTANGIVVNPSSGTKSYNRGVVYKPRPKDPPPQWPWPKVPLPGQRVHGTGWATVAVPDAIAHGRVKVKISAMALTSFKTTQALAQGTTFQRRMSGEAMAQMLMTKTQASGVYDRSLWNQIEEEDQLLADILQVLGVVS